MVRPIIASIVRGLSAAFCWTTACPTSLGPGEETAPGEGWFGWFGWLRWGTGALQLGQMVISVFNDLPQRTQNMDSSPDSDDVVKIIEPRKENVEPLIALRPHKYFLLRTVFPGL
jgi:hypothetical protein